MFKRHNFLRVARPQSVLENAEKKGFDVRDKDHEYEKRTDLYYLLTLMEVLYIFCC